MNSGLTEFGKLSLSFFSCLSLDVTPNQTKLDDKTQVNERGIDITHAHVESPVSLLGK